MQHEHTFDVRNETAVRDLVAGRRVQPVRCLGCDALVTGEMLGAKPNHSREQNTQAHVDWCNRLARTVGVHQPDPTLPLYYNCTVENFGRM